jgi:hypothetical protein
MIITSSQLQMSSSHLSLQQHTQSESLRMWIGQPTGNSQSAPPAAAPAGEQVQLSETGKAQSADDIKKSVDDAVNNDPELRLIRDMLEFLTGRKIRLFSHADLQATDSTAPSQTATPADAASAAPGSTPAAGYGIEYSRHESYSESEQTTFSANGTVKTADGREINFQMEVAMSRSYHEESSTTLRLGDAARKTDPLVLNFSGQATQLTDQRFAFDLNADGQTDQINFVSQGSGFLVFDRNHDGKINDGHELFGPATGNGFGELSQLDSDKNGWIDENDKSFNALQIWSKTPEGNDQLQSLQQAGVGAIALSNVATPFSIKNSSNQTLGEVRSTGIFLQENGDTGTIKQIDLAA